MADPRRTRLSRREAKSAEEQLEQKAPEVDFSKTDKRSEYIKRKLDDILDNIGKSYGKRMADELMKRLEKTIQEFNGEVVLMLGKLEKQEEERLKKAAIAAKPPEEQQETEAESEEEFAEMSEFEKRLEKMERKKGEEDRSEKENDSAEKPKRRGLFRKKK